MCEDTLSWSQSSLIRDLVWNCQNQREGGGWSGWEGEGGRGGGGGGYYSLEPATCRMAEELSHLLARLSSGVHSQGWLDLDPGPYVHLII